MADVNEALEQVRLAAARLAAADVERVAAKQARDEALHAARAARATWAEMEEAAGVSRVTLAKVLKQA